MSSEEHRGAPWSRLSAGFVAREGLAVGIIALAPDRVGVRDFEAFLATVPDVAVFATRVPLAEVVTPASLAAMREHLTEAAARLVPGSSLDAVAFSCTSGTVAIGIEAVRAAVAIAHPGLPVHTPIEAGVNALNALGARRIALLAPYLESTGDLISGHFEAQGIEVLSRATFALDGDRQMNRVSPACLIEAGRQCIAATPGAQALFISCTGLATAQVIEAIEEATDLPVVTSNQALAWDVLRGSGDMTTIDGRGRLFR
ncbi:ectoine utilization protein EutA [Starkeya koreensis]|uniref:Ectoine utilization protein EutA n=1 Tax=Ancylobacter koreensis TaxID=266121 RepID=A0ABT0DLI3_9HYPH|nr:ectoine utilization protein EutA [Ancylobacter koreensis]MCK0207962.1 ectoine utilization protein EutA [Ancylobacter koreensis]